MSRVRNEAWELASEVLTWLRATYGDQTFYTERDVVWTVQNWFVREIAHRGLALRVHNDFATEPGPRRALSADIGLISVDALEVAIEFKYEPSHRRADIGSAKFPVIAWADALRDIERIRRWVSLRLARSGMAVLVDEGSFFGARHANVGHWEPWGSYGQDALDVHAHLFAIPPKLA